MQLSDRQRLSYLYLREGWRRFSRRLALGRISAMRFSGGTPDRLVVAPTDLHPADPFAGEEIAAGRFPLAGRVLATNGESPFVIFDTRASCGCTHIEYEKLVKKQEKAWIFPVFVV